MYWKNVSPCANSEVYDYKADIPYQTKLGSSLHAGFNVAISYIELNKILLPNMYAAIYYLRLSCFVLFAAPSAASDGKSSDISLNLFTDLAP